MPGYAQYQKMAPQMPGALTVRRGHGDRGAPTAGQLRVHARRQALSLRRRDAAGDADRRRRPTPAGRGGRGGRGQGAPERGRQYAFADSPDGTLRAQYNEKDRNLVPGRSGDQGRDRRSPPTAAARSASSTARPAGSTARSSIRSPRCGGRPTAASWRSIASTRARVPDYYLQLDQTKLQSTVDTEAYPKAGAPNPVVDLLIYDVASKKTTHARRARRQAVRQRRGRPLRLSRELDARTAGSCCSTAPTAARTSSSWSPRTRRPGQLRVVLREEWPTGWIENSPTMVFLQGRPPLHLAVRAERLEQLLSLRSRAAS